MMLVERARWVQSGVVFVAPVVCFLRIVWARVQLVDDELFGQDTEHHHEGHVHDRPTAGIAAVACFGIPTLGTDIWCVQAARH